MSTRGGKTPRACFLRPDIPCEAYFFCGDQYVRVSVGPGTNDDRIAYGPAGIIESWPPLKQARFSTVSATVATAQDPHDVYFFSGNKCAFVKVIPEGSRGYLKDGPRSVVDFWPPLQRLGWDSIDAACQGPAGRGEIYFFKGSKYVVVVVSPGGNEGAIIDGPKDISKNWKDTGFSSVDSVLPNYKDSAQAYFFSGSKYALVKLADGRAVDGSHEVAEKWHSLREARFY